MGNSFSWRCATLLALVFVTRPISACINEYEDKHPIERYATNFGNLAPSEYVSQLVRGGRPSESSSEFTALKEKAAGGRFQDRSNYAIALVRQKRVAEALPIFEQVAAEQPDEYAAAANLGTAYELSGDNVKALEWIRKGIALHPEAHDGTEWLHVKILEAKVRLSDDPQWLTTNTILDLDFGQGAKPRQPRQQVSYDGQIKTLADVRKALEYQLRERMSLVESPDAVVADLLATLGNLLAIEKADGLSASVYKLALGYEPAQMSLIHTRLAALKSGAGWYHTLFWVAAACIAVFAIFVGIRMYRRANATT